MTSFGATLPENDSFLEAAAETLRHRGPDDRGFYAGDRAHLGMTRLSIMDVGHGGQPLYSDDRSIVVVFNGEIYNYKELKSALQAKGHVFRTETDGEVLPFLYQEYGLDFVDHLNGIFAIAIWDTRAMRLVLVRDRLGVKPLFYTQTKDRLIFSSEMKTLLAQPGVARELDRRRIPEYLLFRYVAGAHSLFKGIHSLLPGHTMVVTGSRVEIRRYWSPQAEPGTEIKDRDALEAFSTLMDDAVRRQIVSDVPLGALLSGGLDSSYLCALAVRHYHGGKLNTFSIGYDGAGYNELPEARRVAQALGTRSHEMLVNNQLFTDQLETVSQALELPIYQPNAVPLYLICRYAKRFVSVLLSGEGADELFAGYPRYRAVPLFNAAHRFPGFIRNIARAALGWAGTRRSVKLAEALSLTPSQMILQNAAFIRGPITEELLDQRTIWDFPSRQAFQLQGTSTRQGPLLNQLLVFEQQTYLVSLLDRLDRVSMAASIEARVPYLDHRVVELSNRISQKSKLRPWNSKILLKQAAAGLIPPEILQRKKWGFVTPLVHWMRAPNGLGAALDILDEPDFRHEDFFDTGTVRRLVREHRAGQADHSEVLWELLCFAIWHRAYFRSFKPAEVLAQ